MTLEIQVQDLDKQTYVVGLYRWMAIYPSWYIQMTRNLRRFASIQKAHVWSQKYHNKNIDSTIAESMTAKEIVA